MAVHYIQAAFLEHHAQIQNCQKNVNSNQYLNLGLLREEGESYLCAMLPLVRLL